MVTTFDLDFERNYADELRILHHPDPNTLRVSNLDFLKELVANNHIDQAGVLKGITNSLYIPGVNEDAPNMNNMNDTKEAINRKKKHWSMLSFQSNTARSTSSKTRY